MIKCNFNLFLKDEINLFFKILMVHDRGAWAICYRCILICIGPLFYRGSHKITVAEGPIKSSYKIGLSIHISVGIFLENGSSVFSDFLYDGTSKLTQLFSSRKIHFCSNLSKRGPNWSKNSFFEFFFFLEII